MISDKNRRFAAVSDINSDLINSYIAVKDNVEKLIIFLKRHEIEYKKAPKEYYYKLEVKINCLIVHKEQQDSLHSIELVTMVFAE